MTFDLRASVPSHVIYCVSNGHRGSHFGSHLYTNLTEGLADINEIEH